jgi:hypothetical protein
MTDDELKAMHIADLYCGALVYDAVSSLRRLPNFPKNIHGRNHVSWGTG